MTQISHRTKQKSWLWQGSQNGEIRFCKNHPLRTRTLRVATHSKSCNIHGVKKEKDFAAKTVISEITFADCLPVRFTMLPATVSYQGSTIVVLKCSPDCRLTEAVSPIRSYPVEAFMAHATLILPEVKKKSMEANA
jgi:hypothetical protein